MRRGRNLLLAALALPALAAVLVLALGVGRGASAGCSEEVLPEQAGAHLQRLPDGFAYNSFPPTSGPSAERPLVWNAYDTPVSQFRLVHNLLHGGVAAQYGEDVPPDVVRQLVRWYENDPDGIVLAPLPQLGDRIALTAWRRLSRCGSFRERAFVGFRSAYRFNGPERPARETLRRGRGGEPNPLALRVSPSPVRGAATVSFAYAKPATVELEIRRERAAGPVVRRLANVSLLPGRSVSLAWDGSDDEGRPLVPGTYVAVATVLDGERPVTASTAFDVR